ncbi:MAG: efflux RND transporter periplasmic adaptor subunit [Gemmatimonadales bacterium]
MVSNHRYPIAALLFALPTLACKEPPPPAMPPTEVTVVEVVPRTLGANIEFMGAVEAYRNVEIRAQVSGIVLERPFTEGSTVQAGQVLYRIDPLQYDAAWRSARSRLAEAEARFTNAERNLARLKPLLADNAVARRDVDDADAELARARAAADDMRAAVDRAKKDLDEATVRAPIAGRVGRAHLQIGARVTGPGDLLTTIDVIDPVYVSFRPNTAQTLGWRRDTTAAKALVPGGTARIELTLPDGSAFPRQGRIDFVDPVVDPATGTQQYRATFTNPERLLVPGQFVRASLIGLQRSSALAVPHRAVQQVLNRQFVYVVGAGDTVRTHDVKTGPLLDSLWIIEDGIAAGDRVVIDGVQKIGPGAVVKPVLAAGPDA